MADPILVPPVVGEPIVDQSFPIPEGFTVVNPDAPPAQQSQLARGFGAGIQGLRANIPGSFTEITGEATGLPGVARFGAGQRQAAEQRLQQLPPPADLESVIEDPKKALPLSAYSAGNLAASFTTQLGAGGLLALAQRAISGRFSAAPFAAGAAGVSLTNEIGETAALAREAGADPRSARVIAGGVGAAALDFASLLAPAALLLGKKVGPLPVRLAAALIGAPVFESATEAAQDAVKGIAATGKAPSSKELANTFFTTLLGAVPTLGVPGAAGVAIRGRAAPEQPAGAVPPVITPPEAPEGPVGPGTPEQPPEETPRDIGEPSPAFQGLPIPGDQLEYSRAYLPGEAIQYIEDKDLPFYRERDKTTPQEAANKRVAERMAADKETPVGVAGDFPAIDPDVARALIPKRTKGGLVAPVMLDEEGRPFKHTGPVFSPYESEAITEAIKANKLTEEDVRRAIKDENFGALAAIRRKAGLVMTLDEIKAAPFFKEPDLAVVEERDVRERVVAQSEAEVADLAKQAQSKFITDQVAGLGLPPKRAKTLGTAMGLVLERANEIDPDYRDQFISEGLAAALKGKMPKEDQERIIETFFAERTLQAPERVTDKGDHPIARAAFSPRTRAISDITNTLAASGIELSPSNLQNVVRSYLGALPKEEAKALRADKLFLGELKLEIERQTGPNRMLFSKGPTGPVTRSFEFLRWFGNSKVVRPDGSPLVVYHGTLAQKGDFEAFDTKSSEMGAHFGTIDQANRMAGDADRSLLDYGSKNPNAGFSPRVIPVFLSIQNPLRLVDYGDFTPITVASQLLDMGLIDQATYNTFNGTGFEAAMDVDVTHISRLQAIMQNLGFDGIVYLNRREGLGDGFFTDSDDTSTDAEFQAKWPAARDSYIIFEPTQAKSAVGNIGSFSAVDPSILRSQGAPAGAVQGLQPGQKLVFTYRGEAPNGRIDPADHPRGTIHDTVGVRFISASLRGTGPRNLTTSELVGAIDARVVYDARDLRNDPLFIEAQNEVRREFGTDVSAALAKFQANINRNGFEAVLYSGGELRIFEKQSVWTPATTESLRKHAQKAHAAHKKSGWSATNLVSGADLRGTPGYLVGIRFAGRRDFKTTNMTQEELQTYAEENAAHLSNPGNVLHTWLDRNDGEEVAAVGFIVPDLQAALNSARESGQIAVVDMRTGLEIPVSHPVFDSAQTYNAKQGLPPAVAIPYIKAHPEIGRAVALAYDELEVNSNDPDVAASYEAFAREVEAQYEHARQTITIENWPKAGQPYANSAEMRRDVFENKHLWVYANQAAHPRLTSEQNTKFRAVHDLYGHAKTGFEFGATGELNATRAHAQMFTEKAIPALVTETIGQNSWVNFGARNQGLPPAERAYAAQKADLLPSRMIQEALYDPLAARNRGVNNLDAILTEKGAAAVAEVHRIVGRPLDLHVGLQDLPNGITGTFTPKSAYNAQAMIALAYGAEDIMSAAGHEGFHYIDVHVLPKNDRAILDRALRPDGKLFQDVLARAETLDAKNKSDTADEILGNPYEARAYAFQFWRAGDLKVEGPVAKVFQAIKNLLERIRNYIDGLGFTSYEDVFRAIERGAYAQSGRTEANRAPIGKLFVKSGDLYEGSPSWITKPRDLATLRQRLSRLALEGEKHGRFWYEESSKAVLNFMNGDKAKAKQFTQLLAVMSSRTSPPVNLKHALTAWNQYQAGRKIKAGTYPTEMSKTATALLNGTYKPNKFGHEVPGEKRNNFFKNLMIEIDPVVYGPQAQGATIDMWMAHVSGFGDKDGKIGRTQYEFVNEQLRIISERLNWPRHQLQAAIWTAIKARMDATRGAAKEWGIKKGLFVQKINKDTFVDESGYVTGKGRPSYELRDADAEVEFVRAWMAMALKTTIGESHLAAAGYNFSHALRDMHRGETGVLFSKGATSATAPLPQEHLPMLQGEDPILMDAESSLTDIDKGMRRGDAQHAQIINNVLQEYRKAEIPDQTTRDLFLHPSSSIKGASGAITRFVENNVMSLLKLSERSKGVANVAGVLFAHSDRKKRLIADSVEKNLSEWIENRTDADGRVVSAALMERTVGTFDPRTGGYAPITEGSPRWVEIRSRLNDKQKRMFDQANKMVANMLSEEFRADQRVYREALGNGREFTDWMEQRAAQITELVRSGYIPERRFGDFVVHGSIKTPQGPITVFHSQFETQRAALDALAHVKKELGPKFPEVAFEWGTKNKIQYDGAVSYLQFIDTARRLGIDLSQAERERLAKFTIAADSTRRNRVFRRLNVAGFSNHGERVLAEFAVNIANKVAHAEFNSSISDALHGYKVNIQYTERGEPVMETDRTVDMWRKDGPLAGHYRNLMEDRANYVLNAAHDRSDWSSRLRSMASLHFLGGSIAAMGVQLTSLPMFTVPWLFQYTGMGNAYMKVASAFSTAGANLGTLTDLAKLQDKARFPVPAVDNIPGLRDALVAAARDGTILDTELYQIMGMARGSIYSRSKGVQTALKAWMAPFRAGEHMNRLSTFIASYRIGQELAAKGKLPTTTVFDFAKMSTQRTQFRYDEANRPGLAHSNLGALLFVFRSFPLYALEMITTLYKQNPKAANFALLSLWVMAGTEGLPFASNIFDIIDVISQRLFGSPFNIRRAMRNTIKDASEAVIGTDLSGLVMHGMVNYFTGMQFASRVGLGEIIPGTRFGAADADYKQVVSNLLGPIGAMVESTAGGLDQMTRGNFLQGVKTGAPIAARNLLKGFDYWTKGYAEDKAGRKLVDVSGMEAFWQASGFSSAALAEAYATDRIVRQDLAFYSQVRGDLTKELIAAVKAGQTDDVQALFRQMELWNQLNPDMPIMLNANSLRRQIALAGLPLNQRTLLMLPRQLRNASNQEILGLGN